MNVRATIPLPLSPAMRRRLEDTIEQLVSLLDDVDGDVNCEDSDEDVDLAGSFCDREDDGISSGERDDSEGDANGFIWGGGENGRLVSEHI